MAIEKVTKVVEVKVTMTLEQLQIVRGLLGSVYNLAYHKEAENLYDELHKFALENDPKNMIMFCGNGMDINHFKKTNFEI